MATTVRTVDAAADEALPAAGRTSGRAVLGGGGATLLAAVVDLRGRPRMADHP